MGRETCEKEYAVCMYAMYSHTVQMSVVRCNDN